MDSSEKLLTKKRKKEAFKKMMMVEIKDNIFTEYTRAIDGFFITYKLELNSIQTQDMGLMLIQIKDDLMKLMQAFFKVSPFMVQFYIKYMMRGNTGQFDNIISTKRKNIISEDDIINTFENMCSTFSKRFDDGDYSKSGVTFIKVTDFTVKFNGYIVSMGTSYVELPKKIRNKGACINIKNKDNKCFLWCLIANFHEVKSHTDRLSNYNKEEYIREFKFKGIDFPIKILDISRIEKQNDMTINIYWLRGKDSYNITPLYPSKRRDKKADRHVNLLLYENHYILIKRINALFANLNKNNHSFFCDICTRGFSTIVILNKHYEKCKNFDPMKINVPRDNIMKFKRLDHQIDAPFVIYGDFETYLKRINIKKGNKTNLEREHVPIAYSLFVASKSYKALDEFQVLYVGTDVVKHFKMTILNLAEKINKIVNNRIPLIMDTESEDNFNKAEYCMLCREKLNLDKVRDHDHVNGKYRGAMHSNCNLLFTKQKKYIPVVFHNLAGYDLHLFIQEFSKDMELEIIPKSMEKYISMTVKIKNSFVNLRFIDSFHFLPCGLSTLAGNLINFQYIKEEFSDLRVKQFFPYEYFDCIEKLDEKELPLVENWKSVKEYDCACDIFRKYKCKNFKDYLELYLKIDTMLLAEVFEEFRALTKNNYGLDPANYFSTPGLAFDALLKMTNIELELLTDIDMIYFFRQSVRGGISTVCGKKYAKSNNIYSDDYDSEKKDNYIMYWDANNLYGWAMSQPLPYKCFTWIEFDQITFNLKSLSSLEKGYVLEVDIEYPNELHDCHNEFPLAAEHYMDKLCPNLYNKKNYVVQLYNLNYYLEKGMKLIKIHRILSYDQKPWMKDYIDFNSCKRKTARNEFEKDFYKLMNNAVFGKTMENIFKRVDIRVVNDLDKAIKLVKQPYYKRFKEISEDMVLVEMSKHEFVFDKPIYLGFNILELSKLHMLRFHYDTIKRIYGERACLMYTDTDSFVYDIETIDIFDDLLSFSSEMDLSCYPKSSKSYKFENEKVIGKMKDEYPNNMISEFVCLKAKCYSLKLEDGDEKNKNKGIERNVLKNEVTFEDYKNCLFEGKELNVSQKQIVSYNHTINSTLIEKKALSLKDSKRNTINKIYTLAHGHFKNLNL